MYTITGKVKGIIYESDDSNYKVGLFRINKTDKEEWNIHIGKVVTFTGYIGELDTESNYQFKGDFVRHKRYGFQFSVYDYRREEITGSEAILEFLKSPLVKNCGEKTAISIIEKFGDKALEKIKESPNNLLMIDNISEKRALDIYNSVLSYDSRDKEILDLKNMGFTMQEVMLLIKKYDDSAINIVNDNIYKLIKLISFKRLDTIYLKNHEYDTDIRIKACIIEVLKRLSFNTGSMYSYKEEILSSLRSNFNIYDIDINNYLEELVTSSELVIDGDKYYLKDNYDIEVYIADYFNYVNSLSLFNYKDLDKELREFEKNNNIIYDSNQENAIKSCLNNRISIITGGPGTGKTTILNAIVNLYIKLNKIKKSNIDSVVALLAPTGRASRKMSEASGINASTIHRYLKWNKDSDDFLINEDNKNYHKLIIIDEVSMIDTYLLSSLCKGLTYNVQIILVGDVNQLPSVGPGNVLDDLISSDLFNYCPLDKIYRQSINSYIPVLAKEIKDKNMDIDFTKKMDDYNFLEVKRDYLKDAIYQVVKKSKDKGISVNNIQVLVPMYRGDNGIDELNKVLRDIYNPLDKQKEISIGDYIYRENDKVIQLVNDPDNGIYNGDIGYIEKIEEIKFPVKKESITINFDDNRVIFNRSDMINIKHAYAISINKSQGSEFAHVILPISLDYYRMLYNKLIYTGVSRAKKSLVVLGEKKAFLIAVSNDFTELRKTTLKERLLYNIN